ncbi:SpaA isopeptide-forming pilin-related protein [Arcanobacterium wilhelmae]|uniref:SpaA isopeptide-forming pilin-related protein n=1 Tax=Arcanobacterium wilhelmae TaxID=1803177 RepID=UPI002414EF90|nr:SpaA isopeptide-forming pilin-related protein [Arcanobacterium wilhelmae]WFN89873.1 SpaA isopeptide-forming pilin-related protein [Arcanobacterium wilhelmae]
MKTQMTAAIAATRDAMGSRAAKAAGVLFAVLALVLATLVSPVVFGGTSASALDRSQIGVIGTSDARDTANNYVQVGSYLQITPQTPRPPAGQQAFVFLTLKDINKKPDNLVRSYAQYDATNTAVPKDGKELQDFTVVNDPNTRNAVYGWTIPANTALQDGKYINAFLNLNNVYKFSGVRLDVFSAPTGSNIQDVWNAVNAPQETVKPIEPTFDSNTGRLTIHGVPGVQYVNAENSKLIGENGQQIPVGQDGVIQLKDGQTIKAIRAIAVDPYQLDPQAPSQFGPYTYNAPKPAEPKQDPSTQAPKQDPSSSADAPAEQPVQTVTPDPVQFNDNNDGTGSYTVPTKAGVEYLLKDQVLQQGNTYDVTNPGTVTITAQAAQGYALTKSPNSGSGDWSWTHEFKAPDAPAQPGGDAIDATPKSEGPLGVITEKCVYTPADGTKLSVVGATPGTAEAAVPPTMRQVYSLGKNGVVYQVTMGEKQELLPNLFPIFNFAKPDTTFEGLAMQFNADGQLEAYVLGSDNHVYRQVFGSATTEDLGDQASRRRHFDPTSDYVLGAAMKDGKYYYATVDGLAASQRDKDHKLQQWATVISFYEFDPVTKQDKRLWTQTFDRKGTDDWWTLQFPTLDSIKQYPIAGDIDFDNKGNLLLSWGGGYDTSYKDVNLQGSGYQLAVLSGWNTNNPVENGAQPGYIPGGLSAVNGRDGIAMLDGRLFASFTQDGFAEEKDINYPAPGSGFTLQNATLPPSMAVSVDLAVPSGKIPAKPPVAPGGQGDAASAGTVDGTQSSAPAVTLGLGAAGKQEGYALAQNGNVYHVSEDNVPSPDQKPVFSFGAGKCAMPNYEGLAMRKNGEKSYLAFAVGGDKAILMFNPENNKVFQLGELPDLKGGHVIGGAIDPETNAYVIQTGRVENGKVIIDLYKVTPPASSDQPWNLSSLGSYAPKGVDPSAPMYGDIDFDAAGNVRIMVGNVTGFSRFYDVPKAALSWQQQATPLDFKGGFSSDPLGNGQNGLILLNPADLNGSTMMLAGTRQPDAGKQVDFSANPDGWYAAMQPNWATLTIDQKHLAFGTPRPVDMARLPSEVAPVIAPDPVKPEAPKQWNPPVLPKATKVVTEPPSYGTTEQCQVKSNTYWISTGPRFDSSGQPMRYVELSTEPNADDTASSNNTATVSNLALSNIRRGESNLPDSAFTEDIAVDPTNTYMYGLANGKSDTDNVWIRAFKIVRDSSGKATSLEWLQDFNTGVSQSKFNAYQPYYQGGSVNSLSYRFAGQNNDVPTLIWGGQFNQSAYEARIDPTSHKIVSNGSTEIKVPLFGYSRLNGEPVQNIVPGNGPEKNDGTQGIGRPAGWGGDFVTAADGKIYGATQQSFIYQFTKNADGSLKAQNIIGRVIPPSMFGGNDGGTRTVPLTGISNDPFASRKASADALTPFGLAFVNHHFVAIYGYRADGRVAVDSGVYELTGLTGQEAYDKFKNTGFVPDPVYFNLDKRTGKVTAKPGYEGFLFYVPREIVGHSQTVGGPTDMNTYGMTSAGESGVECPPVKVEKKFDSVSDADNNGVYTAKYTITVTNEGKAQTTYSLNDTPQFDESVRVVTSADASVDYTWEKDFGTFVGPLDPRGGDPKYAVRTAYSYKNSTNPETTTLIATGSRTSLPHAAHSGQRSRVAGPFPVFQNRRDNGFEKKIDAGQIDTFTVTVPFKFVKGKSWSVDYEKCSGHNTPQKGLFNTATLKSGSKEQFAWACGDRTEKHGLELVLTKVNGDDKNEILDGSEFTLYQGDPAKGGKELAKLNGDQKSVLRYRFDTTKSEIQTGAYYLVESKAPSGKSLLHAPIVFTVAKNSAGDYTVTPKGENSNNSFITWNTEVDNLTVARVAIANFHTGDLPKSGGAGVAGYAVAGLLVLAGGVWAARRETKVA